MACHHPDWQFRPFRFGKSDDVKDQSTRDCTGDCPPGSYCPAGTTEPVPCRAGTYCPPKSAEEKLCSRGTSSKYEQRVRADDCTYCRPGMYQPVEGMTTCETCGIGSFSANELSCELCPVGYVCPLAGQRAGKPCPLGSTTKDRGTETSNDCGCQEGMYDNATAGQNISCTPCPVGAECTGFGIKRTLAQLPLKPGYWRTSNNSFDLRRCPVHPDASKKSTGCVGGVGDEGPCKAYV